MRIAVVFVAGALVLVACNDRTSAAPPSEPHPPAAQAPGQPSAQPSAASSSAPLATCASRASDLERWMRGVAAEHVGPKPFAAGSLVVVDEPAVDDTLEGPTLTLTGSEALFDGRPVADLSAPATVATQLKSARAARFDLWQRTHPGADTTRAESEPLHVELAPSDVWSNVSVALDAARQAGYGRMTFSFGLASKVTPPPETAVSRAYQKFEAETTPDDPPARLRAARALPTIATITASCPQVVQSLQPLSERVVGASEKLAEFAHRVPTSIETCNCSVGLDEVEAWWWFFNSRYEGAPVASYTVTVRPTSDAGAIAVTALSTDTWASVSKAFITAAKQRRTVSFAAR